MLAALVAFSVGLFPDRAGSAGAPAIVYPPDRALLADHGPLQVLGYMPGNSSGIVTITGRSGSRSQQVGTGAFSFEVNFEQGENTLTLQGQKITVFVPGDASVAIPPGYAPPDTHALENGCEECHSFSGAAATLHEKPPALCSRCHDDVLKGKDGKAFAVLHPPAQEGDCLACHPFHQLAIKRLPAAEKRDLCFGCHDDFTGGGKKRMHAPVANGDCTGCHGPHGTSGKKLLLATGVKLCQLCHKDPSQGKDGKAWEVAHPALDDGCPSCHQPHVADQPRLLNKSVAQVCADCHDPFPTEAGGKKLVRHNPVEEGECAACHAVHGSDLKNLLAAPGKALCVKCHDDPSLAPDGKEWPAAHPALDDGCTSCHLPHVAPAAGLLKKEQSSLCYDCHDAFVAPAKGSSHLPVARAECSLCHAPHGSAVKKLLLAPPGRELCLKCHKDPTLAPGGGAWAVQHPALDEGCPACHLPHVAAAPRLLQKAPPALCSACHEDKNLNGDGESWAVPHPPVADGMCASCHGVHGGPEKALLKKYWNEVCTTCHTDMHVRHLETELNPDTGQPVSDMAHLPPGVPVRKYDGSISCVACHEPHGSANEHLWNSDPVEFCSRCHPL